jgi:serine/threonine protein kinase
MQLPALHRTGVAEILLLEDATVGSGPACVKLSKNLFLRSDVESLDTLPPFCQEFATLLALHELPNLRRCLGWGFETVATSEAGGYSDPSVVRPFGLLEYVEGVDLNELRAARPGGRLAPSEARVIIRRMLEVAAGMHRLGYVHRDFKPANVLVSTADGSVHSVGLPTAATVIDEASEILVCDFGACVKETDPGGGDSGTVTLRYADPEEWQRYHERLQKRKRWLEFGGSDDEGDRTLVRPSALDVWSIAASALELASGSKRPDRFCLLRAV